MEIAERKVSDVTILDLSGKMTLGEGDELLQKPRRPDEPILDRSALALMIPPALTMTMLALALMSSMRAEGHSVGEAQNVVLLATVLFQNAYVLCMRSERRPLYNDPLTSNPWLLLGIGIAIALQAVAMFWAPLAGVLGTGPVSQEVLLFCLGGTALAVVVTELTKHAVSRQVPTANSVACGG